MFDIVVALGLRSAIALSQVCVAAGALTACAARAHARHPLHPHRSLIDIDLALLTTPPLLLGVSGGRLANHAFPSWLTTFLLILLLTTITADTASRAFKLHRREQAAAASVADAGVVAAEGGGAGGGEAGAAAPPPRTRDQLRADLEAMLSVDGEGLAALLARARHPGTDWWAEGGDMGGRSLRRVRTMAPAPAARARRCQRGLTFGPPPCPPGRRGPA